MFKKFMNKRKKDCSKQLSEHVKFYQVIGHSKKMHKCTKCDFSSSTISDLEMHEVSKHNNSLLQLQPKLSQTPIQHGYKCLLCDYTSDDMKNIRKHSHICPGKGFEQINDVTATSQMNKVSNSEPDVVTKTGQKCPFCDFPFDRVSNLTGHIQVAHMKKKRYACQLCQYSSTEPTNLQLHLNISHKIAKICSTKSLHNGRSRELLGKTIKAVTASKSAMKCNFCDYSSITMDNITRHIQQIHKLRTTLNVSKFLPASKNHSGILHETRVKVNCPVCNTSHESLEDMQKHLRSVHKQSRYLKCQFCDFSALHSDVMGRHFQNVHIKEPIKARPLLPKAMSMNQTTHYSSVSYKCRQCTFMASRKEDIEEHMKSVHLQVKALSVKCRFCGYTTENGKLLVSHAESARNIFEL